NCGNCDVCKDPPSLFDGTVLAQKALSAVVRLKENVGTGMLIDVLRGSKKQEILSAGFHNIKTYGAGADISFFDWQQLIRQLISMGYLEIAYDQKNTLKITDAANEVLFGSEKVQLVKISDIKKRFEEQQTRMRQKTKGQ